MWTDSHCHVLSDPDPGSTWERARRAGVGRMVLVGTDAEESLRAVGTARDLGGPAGGVWATVGLHPHEASAGPAAVLDVLARLADDPVLVAVGECGLDYHYDHSPREAQRAAFAAQIEECRRRGLALVVHTREAWEDTWAILGEVGIPARTVFHCFTGGVAEARTCLGLGAYLSFSGIASFANAGDIREAAALCPPERLMIETDSPFLAPVPHRGRPNEPALLPFVGAAVAAARGVAVEAVEEMSTAAAAAAFGLPALGGVVAALPR